MTGTTELIIQLDETTRRRLEARATELGVSVAERAARLLELSVQRPEWADVTEAADIAATIKAAEEERDRARDSAVLHEADAARLREIISTEAKRGGLIPSAGFLRACGFNTWRDAQGTLRWSVGPVVMSR